MPQIPDLVFYLILQFQVKMLHVHVPLQLVSLYSHVIALLLYFSRRLASEKLGVTLVIGSGTSQLST